MPVTSHPDFATALPPGQRIWRYMDFTKFVSLLQRQALFFSRADYLGDEFEGSLTEPTIVDQKAFLSQMLMDHPAHHEDPSKLSETVAAKRGQLGKLTKELRRWTSILCWHANDFESAAMWKLYARTNEAIAVCSTLGDLQASLKDAPEEVHISDVKYIDYKTTVIPYHNAFLPLLHKRQSFAHEREVRAVILPAKGPPELYMDNPSAGVLVPANLETLVREVYVAPDSPGWFRELVETELRNYSLATIPVVKSALADGPLW